jgi:hypothetical protein
MPSTTRERRWRRPKRYQIVLRSADGRERVTAGVRRNRRAQLVFMTLGFNLVNIPGAVAGPQSRGEIE